MDILVVSQLSRSASASEAGRAPMARGPQSEPRPQADGAGILNVQQAIEAAAREIAEAVMALDGTEMPRTPLIRAQLDVDEASRRVYARIFDRETGELVRQVPAEEVLRLLGTSREHFGRILKTDV